jgi:acetyl-CoA synthetase
MTLMTILYQNKVDFRENLNEISLKIADTWWQTETGGNMICPVPFNDGDVFKPGSAQRPFYGIEPVLYNASGKELVGNDVGGALCIKHPWPGIAMTIYNDHERFRNTYLDVSF